MTRSVDGHALDHRRWMMNVVNDDNRHGEQAHQDGPTGDHEPLRHGDDVDAAAGHGQRYTTPASRSVWMAAAS